MILINPKSPETKDLDAALSCAKSEYDAILKKAKAHRSKYIPVKEMIKATEPALVKHNLSLSEGPHIFNAGTSDNVYLLDIYVVTLSHDKTGQFRSVSAVIIPIEKTDDQNQAWNGGVSYKRRKLIECILGIIESDKDDEIVIENNEYYETQNQKPKIENLQKDSSLITTGQLSYLKKLLVNKPKKLEDLMLTYGRLEEIPKNDASKLITELK